MGNSGSSAAEHHRGYANSQSEKGPSRRQAKPVDDAFKSALTKVKAQSQQAAHPHSHSQSQLQSQPQPRARRVEFNDSMARLASSSSAVRPAIVLTSPGALASLGFVTFLTEHQDAVRALFRGLCEAAAVDLRTRSGGAIAEPSDVLAVDFCLALSRLGDQLGWTGNSPNNSETTSRLSNLRRAAQTDVGPRSLGTMLPLGGLTRVDENGRQLISWAEYLVTLKMCEAAAAAAGRATSDDAISLAGGHVRRPSLEALMDSFTPPPVMQPMTMPVEQPPPPQRGQGGGRDEETLNKEEQAEREQASQILHMQQYAADIPPPIASLSGEPPQYAWSGASQLAREALNLAHGVTFASTSDASSSSSSIQPAPPQVIPAIDPLTQSSFLVDAAPSSSPPKVETRIPFRKGAAAAAAAAAAQASAQALAAQASPSRLMQQQQQQVGVSLSDDEILQEALGGWAPPNQEQENGGGGGGGWSGGDDENSAATAAAAYNEALPQGIMNSSAMYKPLGAVLLGYGTALRMIYSYFAFSQKKSSNVAGSSDATFEANLAKARSVNKAGLMRCCKFLGMLGTVANGQAVLLSKEDFESVWNDLLRLHKKQGLDEARFIEALARLAVLAVSRPPLDTLYPSDGDKVDAVFRRLGLGYPADVSRRLRDPSAAGFKSPALSHPTFVRPMPESTRHLELVDSARVARSERAPAARGLGSETSAYDADESAILNTPVAMPGALADLAALAAADAARWELTAKQRIRAMQDAEAGLHPQPMSGTHSSAHTSAATQQQLVFLQAQQAYVLQQAAATAVAAAVAAHASQQQQQQQHDSQGGFVANNDLFGGGGGGASNPYATYGRGGGGGGGGVAGSPGHGGNSGLRSPLPTTQSGGLPSGLRSPQPTASHLRQPSIINPTSFRSSPAHAPPALPSAPPLDLGSVSSLQRLIDEERGALRRDLAIVAPASPTYRDLVETALVPSRGGGGGGGGGFPLLQQRGSVGGGGGMALSTVLSGTPRGSSAVAAALAARAEAEAASARAATTAAAHAYTLAAAAQAQPKAGYYFIDPVEGHSSSTAAASLSSPILMRNYGNHEEGRGGSTKKVHVGESTMASYSDPVLSRKPARERLVVSKTYSGQHK